MAFFVYPEKESSFGKIAYTLLNSIAGIFLAGSL
jgi:hypothetical protein